MRPEPHLSTPAESDADARGVAPPTVAVVLAERHAPMRRTLRGVIEAEDDLFLVADTADLATGELWAARASEPVLVVDYRLVEEGAAYGVADLCARVHPVPVVVLSSDAVPSLVARVLQAGASGFVLKEHADSELPQALRAVARGEEFVSPSAGTVPHEGCGISR